MNKPHIVILGAGFGGMYVAKKLASRVKRGKLHVTVVNKTNYFLFTPLLHEVATGALGPASVAEPLRESFVKTGVRVIQGTADKIDPDGKTVLLNCDGHAHTISYDYLLIATGAETNYYGIPGADKFTYPLKSLADAVNIRTRIIDAFEDAVMENDPAVRARLLSFVVVGGGPTGVETAAELAEFVRGLVKRYYSDTNCSPSEPGHCGEEEPTITLIHTGTELLEMFSPKLRLAAEKRLIKTGVKLKLNTMVTEVTMNGLKMKPFKPSEPAAGSPVENSGADNQCASTIIWTAGVKARIPDFEKGTPALSSGRLVVDEFFRVQGRENVFAMGDAAAYVDVHKFIEDSKNTRPVPMLAQVAVAESKILAANLLSAVKHKPLMRFHYHSKGSMVSVGQWFAIGEIFSLNIAGKLTWWMWRTVYLFKFSSWKKRVRIAIDWTLELLYPRDITKLT